MSEGPFELGFSSSTRHFDDARNRPLSPQPSTTAEGNPNSGKIEERLAVQLVGVNRLANVATLSSCIAHEINNVGMILSGAIMGVEDALREDRAPDPEVIRDLHSAFDLIAQHARRLGDLSRTPSFHTEQLDLRTILSSTLELLRSTGRTKYTKVDVVMPKDPVCFRFNKGLMEQLLIDLICNASDANDSLGETRAQRAIRVVLDRRGGAISLSVEDDGPGVSPEVAARLFEPFVTSKAPGRGTGLGLSAARQIAANFGGTLRQDATSSSGARFVLEIPDPASVKAA